MKHNSIYLGFFVLAFLALAASTVSGYTCNPNSLPSYCYDGKYSCSCIGTVLRATSNTTGVTYCLIKDVWTQDCSKAYTTTTYTTTTIKYPPMTRSPNTWKCYGSWTCYYGYKNQVRHLVAYKGSTYWCSLDSGKTWVDCNKGFYKCYDTWTCYWEGSRLIAKKGRASYYSTNNGASWNRL